MTTTTSRRAILAGAAALPALAAPDALAATLTPDPIFAAIETHKATFMRRMETGAALSRIRDFGPDDREAEHATADDMAREADEAAAFDLVLIEPTTVADVLALIDYVNEFNQGKFQCEDGWYSASYHWPVGFEFEGLDTDPGDGRGMADAMLLNVRDALATLAVRS